MRKAFVLPFVLGLLFLAVPAAAQTPTPVPVAIGVVHSLCDGVGNGDCGKMVKAAGTQDPAEKYFYQLTSGSALVDLWESYDEGTTRYVRYTFRRVGERFTLDVCGPCMIGATIRGYRSGTIVLRAATSGASGMGVHYTPTATPTATATYTPTPTPTP